MRVRLDQENRNERQFKYQKSTAQRSGINPPPEGEPV